MDIKKKIALISVNNYNYGSLLQAFALQKFLIKNGFDNEIILFFEKNIFRQFCRLFKISFFIMKGRILYRNLYLKFFHPELYTKIIIRKKKFEEFKSTNLIFSKPYRGRKSLVNGTKKYKSFVLGSDQVWHPNNMGMDYFNFNFVPFNISKIAYAPSFGVSKIPFYQIKKTKHYLNRINDISVREKSGKEIVKGLIHKDVPIVCDPTLLVNREEWEKLKGSSKLIEQKYIFCYFLGSNPIHREFANRLKKYTGLKIVTLLHMHEYVKIDENFGDVRPFNVGPSEFINLISNAGYVLTDSFHGTIFSILYKKEFYTFYRFLENKSTSTNTRINFILSLLNIVDRRLIGSEEIPEILKKSINYEDVYTKLDKFKESSQQYLIDSLSKIRISNDI